MPEGAPAVVSDSPPVPVSTETGDQTETVVTPQAGDAPSTEPKKEAPPAKRTLKAKVYGEERDVDADSIEGLAKSLNVPPEFILRNLQTSAAAQKRMQEVAEKEKAWSEREARLKADPWSAFGEDQTAAEQAAIARVQAIMEREALSPEQRQIAERDAKIKAFEEQEASRKQEQQTAAQQAETQKVIAKLNVELPAAALAAGLPKSPAVGRMMVEFMLSQARAGLDVNPEDAAQYAKESVQNWTGEIVKGMDGPQLETFLGPAVIKAILTHAVAKARGGTSPAPAPLQTDTPKPKAPTYLSTEEWRAKYG